MIPLRRIFVFDGPMETMSFIEGLGGYSEGVLLLLVVSEVFDCWVLIIGWQ